MTGAALKGPLSFHDLAPAPEDFREAVVRGLGLRPKAIPSKFFYDARGSRLFEEICELEEYYLTRTEIGLLERHGAAIAELIGGRARLVEFGSGSSVKVRILLEAMRKPAVYMPIDISRDHLLRSASSLAREHRDVEVVPVCADYLRDFALPAARTRTEKTVGFFPGSTIGNLSPQESVVFLRRVARKLGPRGELLIGVDLKKDEAVLEAAYDDPEGITARFNLNLLHRANRELGADFNLDAFRHLAFYDEREGRIEMHLESGRAQTVHVDGLAFAFARGETIHTENSYKYEVGEFLALAGEAGFRPLRTWTDPQDLFSVHYLRVG
jgi:dimethylhistidine N-methyltransferase